jgi:methionyl-tRNA formyltransferase
MNPWPGAFSLLGKRTVKVHATRVIEREGTRARAGEVVLADKSRVLVACGEGTVEIVTVQPEGKRAMRASEWVMGRGVTEGDVMGQ